MVIQSSWKKYRMRKSSNPKAKVSKKNNTRAKTRKERQAAAKILTSFKDEARGSKSVQRQDKKEEKYLEESKLLREELKLLKEEVQVLRTRVSDNVAPVAQRGRSASRSNRRRNYRSYSAARDQESTGEESMMIPKTKSRSLSRGRNSRRQRRNSFSAPENKENQEYQGGRQHNMSDISLRGDRSPPCPPPGLGFQTFAQENLVNKSALMNKHHRKRGKRFNGP